MKKVICWIFGHIVDIENSPRPVSFFHEQRKDWIITCKRCGIKQIV